MTKSADERVEYLKSRAGKLTEALDACSRLIANYERQKEVLLELVMVISREKKFLKDELRDVYGIEDD